MPKLSKVILIVIVFSFLFSGNLLIADQKPDFAIDNIWVVIENGDVYVRVKNLGTKGFSGYLQFGIWFDGAFKGTKRRKIVFSNNNLYDTQVCNYSDMGTTKGDGTVKIKVDYQSQVAELSESNNSYTRVGLAFFQIKSASMEVSPIGSLINQGAQKVFTYKLVVKLKGRGQGTLKFKWKTRNNRFGNTISGNATAVVTLPAGGTSHFVKVMQNTHTVQYQADMAGKSIMYWGSAAFSSPNGFTTNEARYAARFNN